MSTGKPVQDAASVPGRPALLRAINERAALRLLLDHAPLTRARVADLTGLSKVTASAVIERLTARGLVCKVGVASGSRGPNAQTYALVDGLAMWSDWM